MFHSADIILSLLFRGFTFPRYMIQEYTAREISPYNISGWSKSPKIHGKVVDRGLATMYFTPQVDSKRHTALFVEHGY